MPVKWTAENDHILLLTLLETHNIKVDGEKIIKAWPSAGERPTARAIRERIIKIKNLSGASPSKASSGSHVNNGIKKEASPKKKTHGKPRLKKSFTEVDKDDEEIITQATDRDAEGTPCPSPRKKRAVRVKPGQQVDMSMNSDGTEILSLDDSGDDFVPKMEAEDDSDDYLRE
ncbi:hypothetical protein ABW19_dt0203426 [Dactylella cylindrospora]|nr:hypothetical protein ABW19_dt0203426 [Dactylella cylindrospora]